MNVKCININGYTYLTIGKTYKVIEEDNYCYYLMGDDGNKWQYRKELFKKISKIRNETINKLLGL